MEDIFSESHTSRETHSLKQRNDPGKDKGCTVFKIFESSVTNKYALQILIIQTFLKEDLFEFFNECYKNPNPKKT